MNLLEWLYADMEELIDDSGEGVEDLGFCIIKPAWVIKCDICGHEEIYKTDRALEVALSASWYKGKNKRGK